MSESFKNVEMQFARIDLSEHGRVAHSLSRYESDYKVTGLVAQWKEYVRYVEEMCRTPGKVDTKRWLECWDQMKSVKTRLHGEKLQELKQHKKAIKKLCEETKKNHKCGFFSLLFCGRKEKQKRLREMKSEMRGYEDLYAKTKTCIEEEIARIDSDWATLEAEMMELQYEDFHKACGDGRIGTTKYDKVVRRHLYKWQAKKIKTLLTLQRGKRVCRNVQVGPGKKNNRSYDHNTMFFHVVRTQRNGSIVYSSAMKRMQFRIF